MREIELEGSRRTWPAGKMVCTRVQVGKRNFA